MPKSKANRTMKRRSKATPRFHDIYGVSISVKAGEPDRFEITSMTDGEMLAIGMATVQWALLEHQLLLDTARMVNRAKSKLPPDATSLSFNRRLSAWRATIQSTVK